MIRKRNRNRPPPSLSRLSVALLVVISLVASLFPVNSVSASAEFIQTAVDATNNAGTSVTASFGSSPSAGNLLVAICGAGTSVSITGPSGFSTAISQSGTPSQSIFYKIASGSNETNLTCSSSSARLGIHAYEYSGITTTNPLDAVNSTTGSSSSPSSGSVTTNTAETLIIAGVTINANTTVGSWNSSFTERNAFQNGGAAGSRVSYGGADRAVSSTGAYSSTAAGSSGAWRGQIAAFKVASPPVLSVDIVNSSGDPVSSPGVTLSQVDADFECLTSTGTLGTSSQRIRVTNTTGNGSWTLSIAATDGTSALWSNGTDNYDFNDPSGSPPGCANGQLTVDTADNGSITPQGGCSSAGISRGNAAFSQGVTDSVTLLSASGSQTGCYFDLTNVNLSQRIPPEVPSSATPYTINMTLTVIAN